MRNASTLPTVLRKKLPPNLDKIKHGNYTMDDNDYGIHLYLKENDIRIDETGSEIIEFLRGKTVLITGATGFIGKLLVEKLLRCCKDIGTLYIIVRSKRGKDPASRVNEYFNDWVFVKLSEIYPNFKDKVIGISGDIGEEGLGLSEEIRKELTKKVNIIYHVAATIRFDEKLKTAVKINIKGTQEIIKLAKECEKLDVLAHVSTAYSNCHYSEVKEEFYTPHMDPQALIDVTDKLSSDVVDRITPGLLGNAPNTYVFTKQIAEHIVKTQATGIPTCIQRPPIVIPSAREPVRSWIDNIYGPAGLSLAAGIGLLHVILGNSNAKCGMVPVDYVVNNCIAASYKTAKDRNIDKVQIFTITSPDSNPLSWKIFDLTARQGKKIGSTNLVAKFFYIYTKCWYWYKILDFLLHVIPGHIIDFVAVKFGKEPRLTKAYSKINKFVDVLSYFTLSEWKFDTRNTEDLWKSLNEKDRTIFSFDMKDISWPDYFDTYMVALREFVLLEPLDNLEEGRTYQNRLNLINYMFFYTILASSLYFLLNTVFCFIPITIIVITLFYYFKGKF